MVAVHTRQRSRGVAAEATARPPVARVVPKTEPKSTHIGQAVTLWLRVMNLVFDQSYQRDPREQHIHDIVENFDPDMFGTLLVSRRENGDDVIIDGQHRVLSLRRMGYDDQSVPCLVLTGLSVAEEARLYRVYNQNRLAPSAIDVFKARIVEGDLVATEINRIIEEMGVVIRVAQGPNHLRAVRSAELIYRGGGESTLRQVMSIVRSAWPAYCDGMRAEILEGVALVVEQYGSALDMAHLVKKLQGELPVQTMARARAIREAFSGGAINHAMARTIVATYNKGLRINQLAEYEARRANVLTRGNAERKKGRTK